MWNHRTASPDRYELLKEYARENRKNMTLAESFLWQNLRANALDHKFLRQHVIGDYIVDFVCRDDGLVIELDGAYHAEREQQMILSTYHDDFPKYSSRIRADLLQKVFVSVPSMLGRKLIYTHLVEGEKSRDLSAAYDLLRLARVVAKVRHVPANGIPIGYGADERNFKPLFLDTGLACRALGLKLTDFLGEGDAILENRGGICEQFVGQHLMFAGEEYEEPVAYCWIREEPSSTAEVDYLVQCGNDLVPVEVKSGSGGKMKGLLIFLNDKHRDFAVRFNLDCPSYIPDAEAKDSKGRECRYALLSLPLYLICQLDRLIRFAIANREMRMRPGQQTNGKRDGIGRGDRENRGNG